MPPLELVFQNDDGERFVLIENEDSREALACFLTTLIRGALGQSLYRVAYLLDDNSIQDEELEEFVGWGFREEDEDDEPLRRIGCVHTLVFHAVPDLENAEA